MISTKKDKYIEAKTAILGGGLSGLATGFLLNQKGFDFQILEKEPECGGLMRTVQKEGFTFDYGGSHIIFSKQSDLVNFLLTILSKNKIKKKRNTKILYKDCLVKYPFENGLSDLPKKENYECLNSFIQNLLKKQNGIEKPSNLKDWFYKTFGEAISEKYLIPYNEKIWKFPLDKLGLDWVERIPDPPMEDIIKASLGIETEGYRHQLYFYYPKVGGIQVIIRTLMQEISDKVTTSFNIKKIKREKEKWIISNKESEKEFDSLVSTIPIPQLVKALDAPKKIKIAASALKYNSLITVMLGINKSKLNNLSWLYIPDKTVLTHRVSFPSNYSSCVSPPTKSSVLAEITCHVNDGVWGIKDNDIIERTANDLSKLGIINKADICFSIVRRTEYAYIINDLHLNENLLIVKNYLKINSIDLVGRFAEFKYLNMDGCVESAMNYAKKYAC